VHELKLDGYRVQAQAACVMSLTVLRGIPAMAAGITRPAMQATDGRRKSSNPVKWVSKKNPATGEPDAGPLNQKPCQYIRGQGEMVPALPIKRRADYLPTTCRSFDQQQLRKRPFVPH
jgi:hypothetical protein